MQQNPFKIAERYIQLRKKCAPLSRGDQMIRINEMIITPLITIFLFMIRASDMLSLVSVIMNTYTSWKDWIEYNNLRFAVQKMYLRTMETGGPKIVTNDTTYMPYVFADAVMRAQHRQA